MTKDPVQNIIPNTEEDPPFKTQEELDQELSPEAKARMDALRARIMSNDTEGKTDD